MQRGEIQAPGGRRTDERGAAHVHVLDGFDAVAPVTEVVDHEVVGQLALVDDLDDPGVVGFQPDGAKVVAGHSA